MERTETSRRGARESAPVETVHRIFFVPEIGALPCTKLLVFASGRTRYAGSTAILREPVWVAQVSKPAVSADCQIGRA